MKILFSLLPLLMIASTVAADAKPPNVVLILSDDQGYTDYGFMGHPDIETPHLDKLASESALFRRGYVPTALCAYGGENAKRSAVSGGRRDYTAPR
jgi:uncharacterized sulfatase